ncbi:MAG: agmatinase [Actinobacteria bacterium]|nr:agmatinase [Actinomycetota bacterium]
MQAGYSAATRVVHSTVTSHRKGLPVTPRYQPVDSMYSPRFTGPATFARLPLVTDLDGVDVAIVGDPFDTGVTNRPGARFAPNAIRQASVMLRGYHPFDGAAVFERFSCVDHGDIAVVPGFVERSYDAIVDGLRPLAAAGVIPVVLGGDHSCTLPHLRAMAADGPVGVVQFDAHTDCWDAIFEEPYNHGTWLRRAVDEGLVDPARSLLVGLRGAAFGRGSGYGPRDWQILEELGFDYLTAFDVHRDGVEATVARIRERVGAGRAYLTFDVDSVDPAFAPGTGTPEPGGFSSSQALQLVWGLAGLDFVGFDVVEVLPAYDVAGITAMLAAHLAWSMVGLAALRPDARPVGEEVRAR